MKTLKTVFALLSLLFVVSVVDVKANNNEDVKVKIEKYITELKLDDNQSKQAREIGVKYAELIQAADNREDKKKYKEELDAKIKEILTEEQYAQYKRLVAKEKRETQSMKTGTRDSK